MSKKTFNDTVNELFSDLNLPDDLEIKRETTSLKISENNKRTWANGDVSNKRSVAIRKSKRDAGSCPPEIYIEVYQNSWGVDRRDGYVVNARKFLKSKGFDFHKDRVFKIITNGLNTVDGNTHKQNTVEWEKKFGFGEWEITSPGIDLLEEYDKVWSENLVPPSVVWHVRFKMANSTPKEIRDYLLPWTNGDYYRSADGTRVENGRYIDIRKKRFPFLTDQPSQYAIFDDREKLTEWLRVKMKRKILTNIYLHQIIGRDNEIKMVGELSGFRIRKI